MAPGPRRREREGNGVSADECVDLGCCVLPHVPRHSRRAHSRGRLRAPRRDGRRQLPLEGDGYRWFRVGEEDDAKRWMPDEAP
jgi:hypothetical protein